MATKLRPTLDALRSTLPQTKLPLLIFAFLLLYFGLYHSTVFVQDDWFHLSQTARTSFAHIADHFNLFTSNSPDPYNYYRPLSSKLSFHLLFQLFDLNPTLYILANLLFHGLNTYLVAKLARHLKLSSPLSAFFYLATAGHFTLVSYPTNLEVLLFTFAALLTLLTYLQKKLALSTIFLILAFMSRETAIIIPFLILSYDFLYLQNKKRSQTSPTLSSYSPSLTRLLPFFLASLLYLFSRLFIYGMPDQGSVYTISLGPHLLTNTLKYLSWNLNITGLLKTGTIFSTFNLLTLTSFFAIFIKSLSPRSMIYDLRSKIYFPVFLWLLPLLPVLFFPDHLDPWNLNLSAAGLAFFLTMVASKLKPHLRTTFLGLTLINFLLAFHFYSQNHWTVTRANLVKQTTPQVLSHCQSDQITITGTDPIELSHAWYKTLGPNVLCHTNLPVRYQTPTH